MSEAFLDKAVETLSYVISQGLNVGIVVGPLVGFVAQYNLIKSSKSVGSFSTDVCAILIFANILRMFFWIDARFEISLVFQSVLMILMMIQLLRLCLNLNRKTIFKQKDISILQNPIYGFWRWTFIESYLAALALFVGILGVSCLYFQEIAVFWQFVGFMSCAIESTLGMPQAFKNQQNKSVKGLSFAMIGAWFCGDAFKTFYFIVKNQPFQFIMCGVIQLSVDILILVQIALFQKKEINEI